VLGNGHDTSWDGDFVTLFLETFDSVPSPLLFKRWSAIATVAAACERRVWAETGRGRTYPNLYVLLMAAPGIGKHIIADARRLWRDARTNGTRAFHVAPDNMTKASLLDRLAKAKRAFLPSSGPIETYHSLLIASEEFSVLFPTYDTEYLGALNSIWNVEDSYEESRRTGTVKELEIERPLINILAGYQPALMATTFPEEAWASGLARRLIMVHCSTGQYRGLFDEAPDATAGRRTLVRQLSALADLYGVCRWTPAAAARIAEWDAESGEPGRGGNPVPTHSKLAYYVGTRTHLVIKLCIVSAVSRSGSRVIELIDVSRAIAWLIEAEATMPDVFRAMLGKSDTQVIEEMHYFVQSMWAKDRRKPVAGDVIRRFLLMRVPHDKVEGLLAAAEKAQILSRQAGSDLWLPRPKMEHIGDVE
jgi:hypothetical protein